MDTTEVLLSATVMDRKGLVLSYLKALKVAVGSEAGQTDRDSTGGFCVQGLSYFGIGDIGLLVASVQVAGIETREMRSAWESVATHEPIRQALQFSAEKRTYLGFSGLLDDDPDAVTELLVQVDEAGFSIQTLHVRAMQGPHGAPVLLTFGQIFNSERIESASLLAYLRTWCDSVWTGPPDPIAAVGGGWSRFQVITISEGEVSHTDAEDAGDLFLLRFVPMLGNLKPPPSDSES